MTEFFQVCGVPSGWGLYHGTAAKPKRITVTRYATVQAAKLDCWTLHREIPVRIYDMTEKPFDPANGLHRALAKIEHRNRENSAIVAVGKNHYLVRYGKYTIEKPVKYKVANGMATARKDSELL